MGFFDTIKSFFTPAPPPVKQLGAPVIKASEQSQVPNGEVITASSPSALIPTGNVNDVFGSGGGGGSSGGSTPLPLVIGSENLFPVDVAKANEQTIKTKVDDFTKSQTSTYQGLVNSGQLSVEEAQAKLNNAVNVYYGDLAQREINRRDTVPYFQSRAEQLKQGVIFLKQGEYTDNGTGELALPTSLVEQSLLKDLAFAKSFTGGDAIFIAGTNAMPLTLRELGELPQNQVSLSDTTIGKILHLNLPTTQELLIVAERIENLKGIPYLLTHPTQVLNIPSNLLADIKDYGTLALTNPNLFKYKLGADVGLFFATEGLGDFTSELRQSAEATSFGKATGIFSQKLAELKIVGYEALKGADISLTAVQFVKGDISGVAVGITKATGESKSFSFVLGEAGTLDLVKANSLPVNLLEHPEIIKEAGKIKFSALQENLARDIEHISLNELKDIAPKLKIVFPTEANSLARQTSIGVLRQLSDAGELTQTSFYSKAFSQNLAKLTELGGISKDLLTGERVRFNGKLLKVELETKLPEEAYFTFTKVGSKTPFAKTFAEAGPKLETASIRVQDLSQSIKNDVNLANINSAISQLKLPKETFKLPKLPASVKVTATRGNQRTESSVSVRDFTLPKSMLKDLSMLDVRSKTNTGSISATDLNQQLKTEQISVSLLKSEQGQKLKLELKTKLLLKTPNINSGGLNFRGPSLKKVGGRGRMANGTRSKSGKGKAGNRQGRIRNATFSKRELSLLNIERGLFK